jgi:hypothetical protein
MPAPLETSQNLDGKATVEADDWGVGANVGLIFEPTGRHAAGAAFSFPDQTYRSPVMPNLKTPAAAAPRPRPPDGSTPIFEADVTLPETLSFSAYHAINERWAILADVTWTKWSHLDELRIKYDNGRPDSVDTYGLGGHLALLGGGHLQADHPLELRAGVAFDESPIPSEQRRTPRIPGADRTWLTFGAGYQFSETDQGWILPMLTCSWTTPGSTKISAKRKTSCAAPWSANMTPAWTSSVRRCPFSFKRCPGQTGLDRSPTIRYTSARSDACMGAGIMIRRPGSSLVTRHDAGSLEKPPRKGSIHMNQLQPGDRAPAFTAVDQNNNTVRLADYKGSKCFIFFYPKANTSG